MKKVKITKDDAIFADKNPSAKCYFCRRVVKGDDLLRDGWWVFDLHDTDEEEFVCGDCASI